jgi:hypothetical protein
LINPYNVKVIIICLRQLMVKKLYTFMDIKRPNRAGLIKKFQYEYIAGLHQINRGRLFAPLYLFLLSCLYKLNYL